MILQAPTPYVPNRQLSFPTAATNFHLRVPNKRRRGIGDLEPARGYVAPPPQFANVPFSGTTTSIQTLESTLQQAAQGLINGLPYNLGSNEQMQGCPVGPSGIACLMTNIANGQCLEALPDCANASALIAQYAAIVQAAYANVDASQYNVATYNNGTGAPPPPAAPASPVPTTDPGVYWQTQPVTTPAVQTPMQGANPPVAIPVMTTAPVTPPPVINPPASSSNAPNQTVVGSGAGQSNTTNPTSILPDLSSVPTWAWYALGGLAALMVVGMVTKR